MPRTRCAAALLRRGVASRGVGLGSVSGGRLRAAAPAAPRASGAPLAPLRPSAAAPRCRPRCRLPALGRPARMHAGRGASGAVAVGGAGWAGGSHPPQVPATRTPPATTAHPRVCGAAAASRQGKLTALHYAADEGHAPCVESLLKAGADASLKDRVSDGAEGRAGGRRGWSGRGWGGRGPAQAPRRLSAPPRPSPAPPGAAASTSAPPPPRRRRARRRWASPRKSSTRRSITRRLSRSWRTPPPTSQRRSAAPRHTPYPSLSSAYTAFFERDAERPVPKGPPIAD